MLQHRLAAGADVVNPVLAVRIHRHDAAAAGILVENMVKSRLEGAPLAEIDVVSENVTAEFFPRPLKIGIVIRGAAIVDHHDMGKAPFFQIGQQPKQLVVRIQRRDNHRHVLKIRLHRIALLTCARPS